MYPNTVVAIYALWNQLTEFGLVFGFQDEQALCEESGGIKMDGDEV